MSQQLFPQLFPLYEQHTPIYGKDGSVNLPVAVIERVKIDGDQRVIRNVYTDKEAVFPESAFTYHWHVLTDSELVVFLSVHRAWVMKYKEFFKV